MGPPQPPSRSTRLALVSLLLTLSTLAGTTLLSLSLLPAAFSSNSTPLLPFLAPPRSIVLLLQQVSLLTPEDGLSSRIAVPTSIQAGWALVAAAGSLVGVVGSGALLLRRGDRYARAALALFCVCLGAAWGGGLVTGITQILLLWVPHDHLTASCKVAAMSASNASQASQCSRRLYALLGIYVGVLLAWGVVAGALLEAQRRICRGLSGEVEMTTVVMSREEGGRGRDVEAKLEDARERAAPPIEAGLPRSAPRPQVTFVVDPWHGHGHQQGHPAMASPQRHPTILRPASARSTPSIFSSPALSSTSSFSSSASSQTLVWSSSPAAKKYSPYSSATPSRSSLLSKSPIVY